MLRQGASVELAAEMQVGAAGAIETETLNLTALRNTGSGRARTRGRTAARQHDWAEPAPAAQAGPLQTAASAASAATLPSTSLAARSTNPWSDPSTLTCRGVRSASDAPGWRKNEQGPLISSVTPNRGRPSGPTDDRPPPNSWRPCAISEGQTALAATPCRPGCTLTVLYRCLRHAKRRCLPGREDCAKRQKLERRTTLCLLSSLPLHHCATNRRAEHVALGNVPDGPRWGQPAVEYSF